MMKKILFIVLAVIFFIGCQRSGSKEEQPILSEESGQERQSVTMFRDVAVFSVYKDKNSADNHFTPSGWMGDYRDISLNDSWMENPYAGSTCIKIIYSNQASSGARWAGIYWQDPVNNWGNAPGGYGLSGYRKLTFWARGEKGGERIEKFKIGGITGEFSDSDIAGIGPVVLGKDWKRFEIDLRGKNLSHIIGGFCWSTNLDANPEGATFYLDDICYVK